LTKAFLKKYNLNVEIIPIEQTVNLFLLDGIDVMSVMWYNEYHKLLNAGINPDELVTFYFSDYDMNLPEDGIYCLEETYKRNPELCCDFVTATLEGWKYAFENPEQAIDIIMRYKEEVNRARNKSNQRWMLNRMRDLIIPDDDKRKLGILIYDDYEKTGKMLLETGSIKSIPDFKLFYRGCIKNVEK
jgi:NitT/TauT family transport system substrate-binding protein